MANIDSAKKRIEVIKRQTEENLPKKSSMKTAIKKALNDSTDENIKEANKKIDKAVKAGIIKKNKAARAKSRIARKVNNK